MTNESNSIGLVTTAPPSAPAPPAPISYSGALQAVWRRWWIVAGAVALCVVVAMLYLSRVEPVYRANAVVSVDQPAERLLDEPMDTSSQDSGAYLYAQSRLMCSHSVLAIAAEREAVRSLPDFNHCTASQRVQYLMQAAKTEVDKRDGSINLGLESPSPEAAAIMANAAAMAYVEYHCQYRRTMYGEWEKILQKQQTPWKLEHEGIVARMADFRREHGISFVAGTEAAAFKAAGDSLEAARKDVTETQSMLASAQAAAEDPDKLAQLVETARETGLASATTDVTYAQAEYRRLLLERAALAQLYGESSRSSAMRSVAAKIEFAEQQVEDAQLNAAKLLISRLSGRLAQAQRAEKQAAAQVESLQQRAAALEKLRAQYADLEREAARSERFADDLDRRIRQLQAAQVSPTSGVRIVEQAEAPMLPIGLPKWRLVGVAAGVGLFLGVLGVLCLEWMDPRLRSATDMRSVLQLPLLGAIPTVASREIRNVGQIVRTAPMSEAAEACRAMRTSVFFGMAGKHKTLLLTSPSSRDGKTILASNLAIAIAQGGHRTLLIDADLRRAALHEVWGAESSCGLADVLSDHVSLEEAIRSTEVDNLQLLPGGNLPTNPSELLGTAAFRALLARVEKQFDYVVIDSPPVLAVTDACVLASLCAGTVFVLRAGTASRERAEEALQGLQRVRARVLGLVANGVGRDTSAYRYSYRGNSTSSKIAVIDPARQLA